MQPQSLGIRFDEECGLTGEMFMGKITKDSLMSPSKMLYLPSQGSSGVVITNGGGAGCRVDVHQHHAPAREGAEAAREGRRGVRVAWC